MRSPGYWRVVHGWPSETTLNAPEATQCFRETAARFDHRSEAYAEVKKLNANAPRRSAWADRRLDEIMVTALYSETRFFVIPLSQLFEDDGRLMKIRLMDYQIDQVAMRSKDGEILSGWTFDRHDASCIRDLVKFAEENKNLIATMKSKVPKTSRGERYESDDEDLAPQFFPDWSQNANITDEPCPFLEKGYHEHN